MAMIRGRRARMNTALIFAVMAALSLYFLFIAYIFSPFFGGRIHNAGKVEPTGSEQSLREEEIFANRRLRRRIWQLYHRQLLIVEPDGGAPRGEDPQNRYKNAIEENLPQHDQLLSLVADTELTLHTPRAEWHRSELAKLTAFIQSRIYASQHPTDCSQRRFVVCEFKNKYGFGSEQHHLTYCLIIAGALNRTMVIENDGQNWIYAGNKGWSAAFQPVSNCTFVDYVDDMARQSLNDSNPQVVIYVRANHSTLVNERARVMFIHAPAHEVRLDQVPYAIPEELADTLIRHHSYPPLFFLVQFRLYLLRGNDRLKARLAEAIKKVPFDDGDGPIVGVQIRRTDKIQLEARFQFVEKYMYWVEAWFRVEEKKRELGRSAGKLANHSSTPLRRRVYLATDDEDVIMELHSSYPHYEFFGNKSSAIGAKQDRYSAESLIDAVIDIHLLAKCDYLVCTFSSQMCRFPYELMQLERGDSVEAFTSLDDIYHFYWSQSREHIAVEAHFVEDTTTITQNESNLEEDYRQLAIEPGDVLELDFWTQQDQRWAFWQRAVNKRTGKRGLFPLWKSQDKWRVVPFPLFKRE